MLTIYTLIDALGWRYLDGRKFLDDILPVRMPLRTVLGFSSGAIPTILTGAPPSVTGHWNLFYFDPQGSPFRWLKAFRFLPDPCLDNRYARKIMKELGRRALGMGPLFECSVSPKLLPWFNYVEKRNIYEHGGISGQPSIFDQLNQKGIAHRVYTYHEMSDERILQQAEQDIHAGAASFYFLYLSEMDMFLHMNCREPEKIEERLRWYDSGLRRVWAAAREKEANCSMTVISDHGMTPVENYCDLVSIIGKLGLKMPSDYLAVYDSTMARFWFFNETARNKVRERLGKVSAGRILSQEELRKLGVYFSDNRFGELIFLLHPGWIVSKGDFNGKGWMPFGMHGYDPADSYSDAIFLSSKPPHARLSSIADVYPCMRRESGLETQTEEVGSKR